jgi:hypothetical protein
MLALERREVKFGLCDVLFARSEQGGDLFNGSSLSMLATVTKHKIDKSRWISYLKNFT